MTKALPVTALGAWCGRDEIPYADSREIPDDPKALAGTQPRAFSAFELGLAIKSREYNIYLAGEAGQGRTYCAKAFLRPAAEAAPAPPDWVYVHNFDDSDRPKIIQLPAGDGRKFKTALSKAVAEVREEIPLRFEQESHQAKKRALLRKFTADRDRLYEEMEKRAKGEGFSMALDDRGALTLYPLVEGKVVSDEEFERLEPDERARLKARGDALLEEMSSIAHELTKKERGFREREKALDKETLGQALDDRLKGLLEEWGGHAALKAYLDALRKDIVDAPETFAPRDAGAGQGTAGPAGPGGHGAEASPYADDPFLRYDVNLFVDNGAASGAPVILEDHPTYFNLLGCIERESELGALYTDFSLIKAGSLHRACGGFLVVKIDDLLESRAAWEGLLRALRSGRGRIEDPADGVEHARTRTIEPEPMPLDVKVVLVGSDETCELLLYTDERFEKLFKLKAHLQDAMPRTPENLDVFFRLAGRILREADLPAFTGDALAKLADFASLLAEDQKKLSLKLPLVRELMIEAAALARLRGADAVDASLLAEARRGREFRANLFEEEFLAEYDREMIKVATEGEAVGRANGLSVSMYGNHAFGLPHQIACTVGVGHGGVLDLEREAELGGPIHTKGMMILKSWLLDRFAKDKPLVMAGALCFEQSYAQVEGDSASAAELAALLSALSERPVRLRYAFTGAVSQSGAILAVGGVNEKIEGFFAVCDRRGLTGRQGVLIPKDNVVNLMLRDDVARAVERGDFHIFPVTAIEEAMEILTGTPAGTPGPDGSWPAGTLYGLVNERLTRLARSAAAYAQTRPRE